MPHPTSTPPEAGALTLALDVARRRSGDRTRSVADAAEGQGALVQGLLDAVASTTPDFVYVFDCAGRFLYANRRLLEVWGMELPDVIGKTCRELGYEQWHHDMHMREIAQVIETRRPIKGEVPFKAPLTGIFGVYEYIFSPVLGADGAVALVAGTTRDVTERKQTEQKLAESEARFRQMADGLPLIVWVHNASGEQEFVNETFCRFFGVTREEMTGGKWQLLMHPEDADAYAGEFLACVRDRRPFHAEVRVKNATGEWRRIESWALPRFAAGAEFCGFVGASADITARKQAEDALAVAQDKLSAHAAELERTVAERTATLKDTITELQNFSYTVSHDLRAPLRSINGFAEAMLEDYGATLEAGAKEYLRRIMRAGERMDLLTKDILSYAKITATPTPLQPLSVDAVLEDVFEINPTLREHPELVVRTPLGTVLAHDVMLRQVLANLIDNAVKYTRPGERPRVEIWSEETERPTGERCRRISVRDNGIGISPEYHERIFGIFERLPGAAEGTGIGLAIVQKAMDRMRGACGVESQLGKGSTFWVELRAG